MIRKFFKYLISDPKKILKFIIKIFFLNQYQKKFKEHNYKIWKNWKINNTKNIILVDSFFIPEWIISSTYFVNVLAKKEDAKIFTFSQKKIYDFTKFRNSYNVEKNIVVKLNSNQKKELQKLYFQLHKFVKTKKELLDYEIESVGVGVDIYESYLKNGKPTIDFDDTIFWETVELGITNYIFWRDFFNLNKVKGVLVSHDCYIDMNIICKIAYKKDIDVFLANARGLHRSNSQYSIYEDRFNNYKSRFKTLSLDDQRKAINWSKSQLKKKLSGEVGVDAAYSLASSFQLNSNSNKKNFFDKNNKTKVLIATHCFFDNPHSYGRLLFTDFYEWLVFLCKISKETNYDWYIKPHPDYLPGTIEIINSIIEQKSDIKLIDPKASFHDLKKEGLSWVITGFGSVGHELPLLDINVINCGPNPHVNYDFNWNPKTIEELKNILLNLKTLSKKIDKDAIYEFYYMYKFSDFLDNFIFNSYYKMLDEQGIGLTSKTYQYFLNEYNDDKHQKIIEQIQTFLKQKSNLSFISHDFIKNKINL